MKGMTVEFKIHQMNQTAIKKQHKNLSLRIDVLKYYPYRRSVEDLEIL